MSDVAPSAHDQPPGALDALPVLRLLDTEAEPLFESLARMAGNACAAPMALLSLVDGDRILIKAQMGLPGAGTMPRSGSFCEAVLHGSDGLLVIEDTLLDPRFRGSPMVSGVMGVRFYAGAPLVLEGGERVGTLCVFDRSPRPLDTASRQALRELAVLAGQALDLRDRSLRRSLDQRQRQQQALAESEHRLRSILDAQRELVSQSTADGRLLYVNPAYARFFGRTVAELQGANLFDFVPPGDRPFVDATIRHVLGTGEVLTSENRMVSSEGPERWVSWTNTRQTAPDGSPLLHSTGRDVTARMQAQEALAHSQDLLERTGRVAGVGGWEVDLVSGQVHWTAETRRIHEVSGDFEPTLEAGLAFYSERSRPQIQAAVERALHTGEGWDLELELVTARGRLILVRAVGDVEWAQGRPVRLHGAFQDVTEQRRASQARDELAAIFEHTSDLVIQADPALMATYMNPAAAQALLGRSWRAGERVPLRDHVTDVTRQRFATVVLPELQRSGLWLGQSSVLTAAGDELPVSHMVIAHRSPAGEIERYSIIFRNIADLVAAQQELERQAGTLRSVANAIPSTVAVVGRDGRYVFVNHAFERLAGRRAASIIGRPVQEVLSAPEFERRQAWLQRALQGQAVRFEASQHGAGGLLHQAIDYLPLHDAEGAPDGFVAVGQDITEAKLEQVRLETLSHTDALTRLLNRAGLERRVAAQLTGDVAEPLTVLYVDLDHFKPVNDGHGHAAGDQVLQEVARRLVRQVRPTDIVARLGGDEFAIAVLGMGQLEQAERLAQHLVDVVVAPVQLSSGERVQVGASVGGVVGAACLEDWDAMLHAADNQLYAAKARGRGRHAVGVWPPA